MSHFDDADSFVGAAGAEPAQDFVWNEQLTEQIITNAARQSNSNGNNESTSTPTIAQLRQQRTREMEERSAANTHSNSNSSTDSQSTSFTLPTAFTNGGTIAHMYGNSRRQSRPPIMDSIAPPMDEKTAAAALNSAGAFKTYKPDAVTRASNTEALHQLSMTALQELLKRQQATLSNVALLKALPDGGKLIHSKVAEIEAAIEWKNRKLEEEMAQVDQLMKDVRIGSNDFEEQKNNASTASSTSAASPSRSYPPLSNSTTPILGRGSAAIAQSCSASQINARIAANTAKDIEAKFKARPPPVISAAEAAELIRIKDADWHANITSDPTFGLSSFAPSPTTTQTQEPAYRDPSNMFDDDDVEDAPDFGPESSEEEDMTSDVDETATATNGP